MKLGIVVGAVTATVAFSGCATLKKEIERFFSAQPVKVQRESALEQRLKNPSTPLVQPASVLNDNLFYTHKVYGNQDDISLIANNLQGCSEFMKLTGKVVFDNTTNVYVARLGDENSGFNLWYYFETEDEPKKTALGMPFIIDDPKKPTQKLIGRGSRNHRYWWLIDGLSDESSHLVSPGTFGRGDAIKTNASLFNLMWQITQLTKEFPELQNPVDYTIKRMGTVSPLRVMNYHPPIEVLQEYKRRTEQTANWIRGTRTGETFNCYVLRRE